jgi:hypothetical protein
MSAASISRDGATEFRSGVTVGWRCWRILEHERLGLDPTVRLCAAGRSGVPKVWEPQQPTVAVCSDFASTHEAPWPGHECGIYAYADADEAETKFCNLRASGNSDGAIGWAFGTVALWGHVVECERGWRAQYAYPLELTTNVVDQIANEIAMLYGVPIVNDGSRTRRLPEVGAHEDARQKEADLNKELARVLSGLRELQRVLQDETLWEPTPHPHGERSMYEVKDPEIPAALAKTGPATARALHSTLGLDPSRSHYELSRRLKDQMVAGSVVQYRKSNGASIWALPGQPPPDGWALVVDGTADLDEKAVKALRRAVDESGRDRARSRDVALTLGLSDSRADVSRVGQSLLRAEMRGYVESRRRDSDGRVQSWGYWLLTKKGRRATA